MKYNELFERFQGLDLEGRNSTMCYLFGYLEGHFDEDRNKNVSKDQLAKWIEKAIEYAEKD